MLPRKFQPNISWNIQSFVKEVVAGSVVSALTDAIEWTAAVKCEIIKSET